MTVRTSGVDAVNNDNNIINSSFCTFTFLQRTFHIRPDIFPRVISANNKGDNTRSKPGQTSVPLSAEMVVTRVESNHFPHRSDTKWSRVLSEFGSGVEREISLHSFSVLTREHRQKHGISMHHPGRIRSRTTHDVDRHTIAAGGRHGLYGTLCPLGNFQTTTNRNNYNKADHRTKISDWARE